MSVDVDKQRLLEEFGEFKERLRRSSPAASEAAELAQTLAAGRNQPDSFGRPTAGPETEKRGGQDGQDRRHFLSRRSGGRDDLAAGLAKIEAELRTHTLAENSFGQPLGPQAGQSALASSFDENQGAAGLPRWLLGGVAALLVLGLVGGVAGMISWNQNQDQTELPSIGSDAAIDPSQMEVPPPLDATAESEAKPDSAPAPLKGEAAPAQEAPPAPVQAQQQPDPNLAPATALKPMQPGVAPALKAGAATPAPAQRATQDTVAHSAIPPSPKVEAAPEAEAPVQPKPKPAAAKPAPPAPAKPAAVGKPKPAPKPVGSAAKPAANSAKPAVSSTKPRQKPASVAAPLRPEPEVVEAPPPAAVQPAPAQAGSEPFSYVKKAVNSVTGAITNLGRSAVGGQP